MRKKSAKLSWLHYYLLLDVSVSTSEKDNIRVPRLDRGNKLTIALADAAAQLGINGINLITFGSKVTDYGNVAPADIKDVASKIKVWGSTNLAEAIHTALSNFHPEVPCAIIAIADVDDEKEVAEAILAASRKIDKDEQLAIGFFQIGDNRSATFFLQFLDNELQALGVTNNLTFLPRYTPLYSNGEIFGRS